MGEDEAWKETVKAKPAGPAVFGKYRLVRELGRGGMGVVYEAQDAVLRRTVALKLLHAVPGASPEELRADEERFLREARICAGLPPHPGLVRVHEAGVVDGKRYLAMEFLAGRSMEAWRRGGERSLRAQVALLRNVLVAIHHAHENGVVHRDLKPQNVMVDDDGAARVLDFGLAKQTGKDLTISLTASMAVMGTPAYMSPEQARGAKHVDRRTDVWSAGIMLYESLTGRLPFTGSSAFDVLLKISKFDVPLPSQFARGVDRVLETICLKALARCLEERYASAADFAADLDRWLKGQAVRVVAPKRRSTRRLGLWALTGASLAVAALALGFGLRKPPGPDPAETAAREKRDREERDRIAVERSEIGRQQDELQRMREDLRKKSVPAPPPLPAPVPTELQERLKALEAELERRNAPPPPPPAPPPPPIEVEVDWSSAIDLMPRMDPALVAARGNWTLKGGALTSDASAHASILSDYEPPAEYDFRVVFSRLEGQSDVYQILLKDGRPFLWAMGVERNSLMGFGTIGGAWLHESRNPTAVRSYPILENGRRHVSVVEVRKDGLKAVLDGRRVVDWKADFSALALPSDWSPARTLGVGSWGNATTFHSVEVREVSGQGRRVR